MNTVIDLLPNLWNLLACIGELLGYLMRFVSAFFQTRASLAARLVAELAEGIDHAHRLGDCRPGLMRSPELPDVSVVSEPCSLSSACW